MNFVYNILEYFRPVGVIDSAEAVYYGVGSVVLIFFIGYLFYKVIRWIF